MQMVSFLMEHLGGTDKGVGRAAGPPLRAEPAKLRGGIGRHKGSPFGAILAEFGGEDCTLELSDSSALQHESSCQQMTRFYSGCICDENTLGAGEGRGGEGRSEVPCKG